MKYKLLFFFITGMLLASCSKIEDEYVYDTGYAIDWSAAADSASFLCGDVRTNKC